MSHVTIDAIVAGHICLDIIPAFPPGKQQRIQDIFIPGRLVNVEGAAVSTGGQVSNVGIALHKLGMRTQLIGKIGDDFFGSGILDLLKKINADDGMTVVDGEQTSYSIVLAIPGIDRMFLHNPGANDSFRAADINYDLVKQARLFHFGYPPVMQAMLQNNGDELVNMYKRVKKMGVTTSLDMCFPDINSESGQIDWDALLQRLLPYVDIFIPSIEETIYMLYQEQYKNLSRAAGNKDILDYLDIDIFLPFIGDKCLDYGSKIAAIKCGTKGIYIKTKDAATLSSMGHAKPADPRNWGGRELLKESYHIESIASATGAGDSSVAGFITALLGGESIERALQMACAVGAMNIQEFDAVSGVKSINETREFIRNTRNFNKLNFKNSNWHYDEKATLWTL
ncbi:MAG: carbohydrate kinase family protein [candidate division KSB1 bacterium]|nr:carbohydrate kinase family protein [candidate division KSB1 bacterium]